MKRVLFCLTLAALPSLGGSRQGPVASIPPIVIYAQFQEDPSSAVEEALQTELETIMNPVGLHFEWRDLNGAGNATAVELVVVTFRGHCGLDRLQPVDVMPGPLGWTHVSNGIVLPFSEVDCSAVRGFLQRELLARPPSARPEIYGRALGRVLAHELYHVLADTESHGVVGVAKSGYTVVDLLAHDFAFEAAELRALLGSKAHQALEKAISLAP